MKQFLTACLLMITLYLPAQTWQDTTVLLDKLLSRYSAEAPGAQLAISRGGRIVYSFAKGLAELENKVPLTKESLIEAGSVSKQFTAACILLLEQQGKLLLSDDVRKYVPEIPDYKHVITLHHLLHHTSGLKDWGAIAELSGWPRTTKSYTNEDALHFISLQKTLNNIPGDEYIYSNSNYNLLAIIVQRVSGSSLADFSAKYIFQPAGMTHTSWRDNYRRIVPNRAVAYSKIGNTYLATMPNENAYGNGGLLTTTEDLLKWNDYYLAGKLGTSSLLNKQKETEPLNNGNRNSYAAGLLVDSTNGWASITHSGATAGYRANMEYYPDLDMSIAWLSNTSQAEFSDIFSSVRNLLVKSPATIAPPNFSRDTTIPVGSFTPYLGAYRDTKTSAGIVLYESDGAIYFRGNSSPLLPLSASELFLGKSRIQFNGAKPRQLRFIEASGNIEVYEGTDSARTDSSSLLEYVGTYYSDETESATAILMKKGTLYLRRKPGLEVQLLPLYKDGFSFPGGVLYFHRDTTQKLTGFLASIPRARNVNFVRRK